LLIETIARGKASALGGASGAVAGLVAITPACGYVGVLGALAIGAIAGVVCFWGVTGLKLLLGADDSLDVFGVHGVGGIVGAMLTGVFAAPSLGGVGIFNYITNEADKDYDMIAQLITQGTGVLTTIVVSGVVSLIAFKLVDLTIGLRVSEEEEREGLDVSSHGEGAYRL
jgi:Amt family ammonium transporter